MEPRQYTTERGVAIGIIPIPLLLEEIRKAHAGPKRPTYIEKVAGGATQEVEISDADAHAWQERDPDSWAEHAEKWAAYIAERDAVQEKLNEHIREAIIRRAVVFDMPDDDGWIQEHELLGLSVPSDKTGRRAYYIRTEVIGGIRDLIALTAIANGSDITEEAISLAEDSFRGSLARSLLAGLARQGRPVDVGDTGGTDSSVEGMGAKTE